MPVFYFGSCHWLCLSMLLVLSFMAFSQLIIFLLIPPLLHHQHPFAVGYGNKKTGKVDDGAACVEPTAYPGYRKMTRDDVYNKATRRLLLREHASNQGWVLLEDPLVVKFPLCVAEGLLTIDGVAVTVVGKRDKTDDGVELPVHNVYTAIFEGSELTLTAGRSASSSFLRLMQDAFWSVHTQDIEDHRDDEQHHPCLYVCLTSP
jgi:hypothetical protein